MVRYLFILPSQDDGLEVHVDLGVLKEYLVIFARLNHLIVPVEVDVAAISNDYGSLIAVFEVKVADVYDVVLQFSPVLLVAIQNLLLLNEFEVKCI